MAKPAAKCFFLFACCSLFSLLLAAQPEKIYFNPRAAVAEKQSKFIEVTDYVPLQETAEPINNYSNLILTTQYIILNEYSLKRLSFFTREGKFVKKIELKKYGQPQIIYDKAKERLCFNIQNKNYILTPKDLQEIKADYSNPKNKKYFKNYVIDLSDSSLMIRKTAMDPYQAIGAYRYYDDYFYLSDINTGNAKTDSIGYEFQLLENYLPVRSFFPFDKRTDARFKNPSLFSTPHAYFFATDTPYKKFVSRPYNTSIYQLVKDSIWPAYDFMLPLDISIPSSFFEKGFRSAAERDAFQNNNGKMFNSFLAFNVTPRYIFFSVLYMQGFESYIYEKRTQQFYKNKMVKADSTQFNIPLLGSGPGQQEDLLYYAIIKPETLFGFYEKNKDKNIVYPPRLEAYLKAGSKNANPVLVAYKIKD
ncbi:MAG: hypothetical protein QM687_03520 [Ferruginibacter sp.]